MNQIARWRDLDRKRFLRIGRELAVMASGSIGSVLGGAVGVRLLTGCLTPAAYGQVALAMTIATLSGQVLFGPLANAVVRFFAPLQEEGKLDVYFATAMWVYGRAFAAMALIGLLASVIAVVFFRGWSMLIAVTIAYATVIGINGGLDSVQNAARQRSVVSFHSTLGQWLRFLCAVGAIYFFHAATGTAAISGYLIGAILVLFSQTLFFLRIFKNSIAHLRVPAATIAGLRTRMWQYAWPYAAWAPFTWVQLSADRWALNHYVDIAHVGLYQAMYQVGYQPMSLASGFVLAFITPIVFARAGDGSKEERILRARKINNTILLSSIALTGIAVLVGAVFHRWICVLMLAPAYRSESYLLPIFLLGGGLFNAGQVLTMNSIVGMSTKSLLYPKIGMGVLGTVLTVVLTQRAGLPGTAIAGAVSAIAYILWLFAIDRKRLSQEMSSLGLTRGWAALSQPSSKKSS